MGNKEAYRGLFKDFDGSDSSFEREENSLRSLTRSLSQRCYVFKCPEGDSIVIPSSLVQYVRDENAKIRGMSEKGILHNGSVKEIDDGTYYCSVLYAKVDSIHRLKVWTGRLEGIEPVTEFKQIIGVGTSPEEARAETVRCLDQLLN